MANTPFDTRNVPTAIRDELTHLYRLTPDVYAKLEKQCASPAVTSTTSELEAGYKLGVQQVLKLLREGFSL